ncbi:MAG: pyridoxal 5'-phosphate synthase glutaminase subunit PdxT [Candidatus Izemoplasmatales bacterium]
MRIGVLALQGAFIEHQKMLTTLNVESFTIRNLTDLLQPMDAIILPGGESTVIYKLLKDLHMEETLKSMINSGLPTLGTCAGLLLLAKNIHNYDNPFLQTMDITARKNAYGKQLGSFRTIGTFNGQGNVPFVFIRAPYIEHTGKDVEVLAVVDDKIVAARDKSQLATAFHPELTDDLTIHKYFINMINK